MKGPKRAASDLLRTVSLTSCRPSFDAAPESGDPTLRRAFQMTDRARQSVPFAPRAADFLARHRLLLALIAIDAITKIVAFLFLPLHETVSVLPGLELFLAVNDWGVMGGVDGIKAVTANPAYTMFLALGLLVFAHVIVRLGESSLAFGWRFLMGLGVFLAVAFLSEGLAKPLSHISMPLDVVVMTIRLAALVVAVAFYSVSQAPMPRLIFTFFAAGALSNSASYLYPPFEVIDFLMVPIGPVLAALGEGAAAETKVGVINMADLYLFAVPFLVAAWLPVGMFRFARRRKLSRAAA
jgi:lipoprotein signal peptidase